MPTVGRDVQLRVAVAPISVWAGAISAHSDRAQKSAAGCPYTATRPYGVAVRA